MASTLFKGTTMLLSLEGLRRNGVVVTDAVVELIALTTRAGATPGGITLPLTLQHTEGGNYEAEIPAALAVEVGDVLTGKIRATSGFAQSEWVEVMPVRVRQG